MNYSVGQVVYAVMADKLKVVPVKIVEEINRKTINGQTTAYMVQHKVGSGDFVEMTKIRGDIYDDLDEVENLLVDNIKSNIRSLIEKVEEKAQSLNTGINKEENFMPEDMQRLADQQMSRITLEDGTIANIKL